MNCSSGRGCGFWFEVWKQFNVFFCRLSVFRHIAGRSREIMSWAAARAVRWSELAVAGTCVDLLTDGWIFAGGKKGGSIERKFFWREIVNGRTY